MVRERLAGLAHGGDEARARGEVVDQVARVEALGELAPLPQVGRRYLCSAQHLHDGQR